jgi:hypothetical protein
MPHSLLSCGKCDVLVIVVHKNVRLSEVIVSDILDSDHLPVNIHLLDYVYKFTDWELFQAWPLN